MNLCSPVGGFRSIAGGKSDLEIAEDGSFEVILSREEQPGNWVPLPEGKGHLYVREWYYDLEDEDVALLEGEHAIDEAGGAGVALPVLAIVLALFHLPRSSAGAALMRRQPSTPRCRQRASARRRSAPRSPRA